MAAGPVFTINVAFTTAGLGTYGFYDYSHYNDGSEYAPNPGVASLASDVGAYVRFQDGVHIRRGSSAITDTSFRAEAGTFSCTLDNRDRRFDPLFTTGPYVVPTTPPVTKVEPGVQLQVKVTANGNTYTLFTGYADAWPQTYPGHHRDQTCQLKATDATFKLANAQLPDSFLRPHELSGARMSAVLDFIDANGVIPHTVDNGLTEVPANIRGTTNVWSLLQDVNDAEWGDFYVANDGTVTFRDRQRKFTEARSTVPQAIFGDAGGAEIPFFDVTMADTLLLNDVTIVYNDSGSSVNATDSVSILKPSGRRSHNKAIPFFYPQDAQSMAAWIVYIYGRERARFGTLALKPLRSTAVLAQVAREVGDRITIKLTPSGGGARIIKDCWIRGIQHDFQAGDWTMTFTLEDASSIANVGYYDVTPTGGHTHYDDGSIYAL